jgi:hypothetical membrane protein
MRNTDPYYFEVFAWAFILSSLILKLYSSNEVGDMLYFSSTSAHILLFLVTKVLSVVLKFDCLFDIDFQKKFGRLFLSCK